MIGNEMMRDRIVLTVPCKILENLIFLCEYGGQRG